MTVRRQYYTYSDRAADARPKGESADAAAGATRSEVVYSPAQAREALEGDNPAILVMARGKELAYAVAEAADAGMSPYAACVDADGRAADVAGAAGSARLGEAYSDELFSNAHAVLQAAWQCGAQAVLLCGRARDLVRVDAFLSRAATRNIAVYSRYGDERSSLGWIRCEMKRGRKPGVEASWLQCPKCQLHFDEDSLAKRHYECPACGSLFRLTSTQRISAVLDDGSFEEWDGACDETDPLAFPGYLGKLETQRIMTGLDEAVRTGAGCIGSTRTAFAVMESKFLMGSMGSVVGERLSNMFDRATAEGLPAVVFCASGGARMQEGLVSLMQMAKVSCAVKRHADAGLLYVSVITDPTTGGVTASFATQGDIILAEPHALIGFAGRRVIQDTIRQELPDGFQTAEFALAHGLIDAIVPRGELRAVLANLLALHHVRGTIRNDHEAEVELSSYDTVRASLENGSCVRNRVIYELPSADDPSGGAADPGGETGRDATLALILRRLAGKAGAPWDAAKAAHRGRAMRAGDSGLPAADPDELGLEGSGLPRRGAFPVKYPFMREHARNDAWQSVQLARNTHRPTALRYLDGLVDRFVELHGDRAFGDDAAIVAGIGWIGSTPATVIAQEKGATLKDRLRRNFGCPQPEGYRKSLRLMRQAEKFGRPIVCLVDTQGAFCGVGAEERGQGNAIADNLAEMAGLRVPIVSVLLGEGGSGGALALALANRVGMQEHAVYSVLSPEGFASILWKDRSRAPEAATVMRMDAAQVHAMGIVDDVVPEGDAPAHENPDQAVENVMAYIRQALRELAVLSPDELVAQRQERFARY